MTRSRRNPSREHHSRSLAAALVLLLAATGALAGGIAPVEKHRAPQISGSDVVLAGSPAATGPAAPASAIRDLRQRIEDAPGARLASDVQDGNTFQDVGDRLSPWTLNFYLEDPARQATLTELESDVQDGNTFQDVGDRLSPWVINFYLEDPARQATLTGLKSDVQDGNTFQDVGDRLSPWTLNFYLEDPARATLKVEK